MPEPLAPGDKKLVSETLRLALTARWRFCTSDLTSAKSWNCGRISAIMSTISFIRLVAGDILLLVDVVGLVVGLDML